MLFAQYDASSKGHYMGIVASGRLDELRQRMNYGPPCLDANEDEYEHEHVHERENDGGGMDVNRVPCELHTWFPYWADRLQHMGEALWCPSEADIMHLCVCSATEATTSFSFMMERHHFKVGRVTFLLKFSQRNLSCN